MHAQKCPWLLRADRRGSARRGGPGSANGCRSWWCARHCGRAIPGWCVCLPLAPAGGWPYLAIGQRGGATTSVGRCGSSPALPSQTPPRPGEPLFERLSHRGGGAPVAHGLPQSRRFTLARTTPLRSPLGSTSPSRLLPPMLQTDQGRGLALLKVAVHGISDLPLQLLQTVCLRVNGGADGAGQACGNPP